MSGNLEIGLESDTQVGIDNISFRIKTTYIYVYIYIYIYIYISRIQGYLLVKIAL